MSAQRIDVQAVLECCPSCKGTGEHEYMRDLKTCARCDGSGERRKSDLFLTAHKLVRLFGMDPEDGDARDALWCEIDNEVLSAAYEIEEYRAALAAIGATP